MSNQALRTFRSSLAQWKQNQLQEMTQDDQDTLKLNGYLKLTGTAYAMFKEYLDSGGTKDVDPLLKELAAQLGNPSSLSSEQLLILEDILFRDLVEYPFTYNTTLINSFSPKNALDTNIVPNK